MADIFDYIKWRGDLSLERVPLNAVDALILSRLAYFPFDGLWDGPMEDGKVTVAEACRRLHKQGIEGGVGNIQYIQKEDGDLFPALAASERFGTLKLKRYVNRFNPKMEKQFSAVTLQFPGAAGHFLAYRGTDNTFVGWNEDFNMSFSTPVPAQIDAVEYLQQIASQTDGILYLGGHSKGGNLAAYASMFCSGDILNRIKDIYNFDGPGFNGEVVKPEAFARIDQKLHTYIPQSSVVGLLMEHQENYQVVHSRQIGVLQHDVFSWQIEVTDFVRLSSITEGSRFINCTLKEWLSKRTLQQRKQFIEALFGILYSTEADSFSELKKDLMKNSGLMLKKIRHTDPETRKMILETLSVLFQSAQEKLPEFLPQVSELTERKKL